jgi:hypothetical protein
MARANDLAGINLLVKVNIAHQRLLAAYPSLSLQHVATLYAVRVLDTEGLGVRYYAVRLELLNWARSRTDKVVFVSLQELAAMGLVDRSGTTRQFRYKLTVLGHNLLKDFNRYLLAL